MNAPEIEAFREECVAFFDATVPARRSGARPGPCADLDPIVLFRETDPAHEQKEVVAARAFREKLHSVDLSWISGPREFGGRGLTSRYEAVFAQVAAGYEIPDQTCFGVGLTMVVPTLLMHADSAMKKQYLQDLVSGSKIACQLFSEPGAGSDLAGMSTKAVRSDDGKRWVISGQKVWTSGAQFSDVGEIICRTDTSLSKHEGLTAFMVDMHAPGVEVRPLRQMTGGASFNEVFLDNVVVKDEDRLGQVNKGWSVALTTLMHERKAIGAGGVQDALSGVRRRLTSLLQRFELNSDPLLRQELMKIHTGFRLAQITNQLAIEKMKAGGTGNELSMAKLALANNLSRVSQFVSAVLGPRLAACASASEEGWARFVCSTPAVRIFGGTDEIIRNVLAERVLGLPKEGA
jgi:alkylation response protein AidB-like acyl-CoA dehydrogenase